MGANHTADGPGGFVAAPAHHIAFLKAHVVQEVFAGKMHNMVGVHEHISAGRILEYFFEQAVLVHHQFKVFGLDLPEDGRALVAGTLAAARRGGVLLSLLVLPLSVPLLIFACGAIQAGAAGLPVDGYLAILAAFLAASATLCPFATAAALRLTVQ